MLAYLLMHVTGPNDPMIDKGADSADPVIRFFAERARELFDAMLRRARERQ